MEYKIKLDPGNETRIKEFVYRILGAVIDRDFEGVDEIISVEMKKLFDFEGAGPECMDPDCAEGRIDLSKPVEIPAAGTKELTKDLFFCSQCGLVHSLAKKPDPIPPEIVWTGKDDEEWCYFLDGQFVKKSELPEKQTG